jgi:hypothetical protein
VAHDAILGLPPLRILAFSDGELGLRMSTWRRTVAVPGHLACADHGRQGIIVCRIRPCVAEMSLAKSWDGVLAADRASQLLLPRGCLSLARMTAEAEPIEFRHTTGSRFSSDFRTPRPLWGRFMAYGPTTALRTRLCGISAHTAAEIVSTTLSTHPDHVPNLPVKPEEGAESTIRGAERAVTHRRRHPYAVPVENGRACVYLHAEDFRYLAIWVV